jgi:hypothetical protein
MHGKRVREGQATRVPGYLRYVPAPGGGRRGGSLSAKTHTAGESGASQMN